MVHCKFVFTRKFKLLAVEKTVDLSLLSITSVILNRLNGSPQGE